MASVVPGSAAAAPHEPPTAPAVAPGVPETTQFSLDWAWTMFGERIGANGLEVLDLDGDGVEEIVASAVAVTPGGTSRYWYVARYGTSFEQIWTSLPTSSAIRAIQVHQAPSENLIVVVTDTDVAVYGGASLARIRTFAAASPLVSGAAIGDLSADGTLELVTCTGSNLFVQDLTTGTVTATVQGMGCTAVALGQTDLDPALEIAVARASGNLGIGLDGVTLAPDWTLSAPLLPPLLIADLDGDALGDLVARWGGLGFRAYEPATGDTLWDSPVLSRDFEAADLDGDTVLELAVLDFYHRLYVIDGATGAERWSLFAPHGGTTKIGIGQADGDPALEIVWGVGQSSSTEDFMIGVDSGTRAVEGRSPNLTGPLAGLSPADFDGDGDRELLSGCTRVTGFDRDLVRMAFDLHGRRLAWLGPPIPDAAGDFVSDSVAIQLGDDPAIELCLAVPGSSGANVMCADGNTPVEEWTIDFEGTASTREAAASELDGEPALLIATDGPVVYAFDADSRELRWQTPDLPEASGPFSGLRVGEVNENAGSELVAGGGFAEGTRLTVFAASSGSLVAGPFETRITSFDLAEFDEVIGLDAVIGTPTGVVARMDLTNGALSEPLAQQSEPIRVLRLADLSGDGRPEVIYATDGHLRVLDGATNAELWVSPYIGPSLGLVDQMLVGELDGDARTEILVTTGYTGFAMFEAGPAPSFADGFESGDTSGWSSTLP